MSGHDTPKNAATSKNYANDGTSKDHAKNAADQPESLAAEQRDESSPSTDYLHPDNPQLIRELRERYTLTVKQAKRAIAKGLGASNREAYKAAGTACSSDQSLDATASRELSKAKVQDAADDVFARNFRQLREQGWELDEQRILADLELLKKKGVENQQLGPAVRATELQGRAIGVQFTEHKVQEIQQLSDVDVLRQIAGENPGLARELSRAMAIDVDEYSVTDNEKPTKSDS